MGFSLGRTRHGSGQILVTCAGGGLALREAAPITKRQAECTRAGTVHRLRHSVGRVEDHATIMQCACANGYGTLVPLRVGPSAGVIGTWVCLPIGFQGACWAGKRVERDGRGRIM
jgi:hypothetical protein